MGTVHCAVRNQQQLRLVVVMYSALPEPVAAILGIGSDEVFSVVSFDLPGAQMAQGAGVGLLSRCLTGAALLVGLASQMDEAAVGHIVGDAVDRVVYVDDAQLDSLGEASGLRFRASIGHRAQCVVNGVRQVGDYNGILSWSAAERGTLTFYGSPAFARLRSSTGEDCVLHLTDTQLVCYTRVSHVAERLAASESGLADPVELLAFLARCAPAQPMRASEPKDVQSVRAWLASRPTAELDLALSARSLRAHLASVHQLTLPSEAEQRRAWLAEVGLLQQARVGLAWLERELAERDWSALRSAISSPLDASIGAIQASHAQYLCARALPDSAAVHCPEPAWFATATEAERRVFMEAWFDGELHLEAASKLKDLLLVDHSWLSLYQLVVRRAVHPVVLSPSLSDVGSGPRVLLTVSMPHLGEGRALRVRMRGERAEALLVPEGEAVGRVVRRGDDLVVDLGSIVGELCIPISGGGRAEWSPAELVVRRTLELEAQVFGTSASVTSGAVARGHQAPSVPPEPAADPASFLLEALRDASVAAGVARAADRARRGEALDADLLDSVEWALRARVALENAAIARWGTAEYPRLASGLLELDEGWQSYGDAVLALDSECYDGLVGDLVPAPDVWWVAPRRLDEWVTEHELLAALESIERGDGEA